MKARVMGGVVKLEGAALAQQDQREAEFESGIFANATEIRLSKADGERYARTPGQMAAFLACLARWARRMAEDGYRIVEAVEPGPGTMAWKAVKE